MDLWIVLALTLGMVYVLAKEKLPVDLAAVFIAITLIGSSTNILVGSIAASHGQPPFTMFEFAPLGLVMAGSGILYMLLFGIWLIPDRRAGQSLSEVFDIAQYLTDVVLLPEAKSVGKPALASPLAKDLNVQILAVFRDGQPFASPLAEVVLAAGDVVRLQCDTEQLAQLPPHRRHSPEHLLHGSFPGQRSSPRAGLPLRLCPRHPPRRSPPAQRPRPARLLHPRRRHRR